jgi:hypothetical protein
VNRKLRPSLLSNLASGPYKNAFGKLTTRLHGIKEVPRILWSSETITTLLSTSRYSSHLKLQNDAGEREDHTRFADLSVVDPGKRVDEFQRTCLKASHHDKRNGSTSLSQTLHKLALQLPRTFTSARQCSR